MASERGGEMGRFLLSVAGVIFWGSFAAVGLFGTPYLMYGAGGTVAHTVWCYEHTPWLGDVCSHDWFNVLCWFGALGLLFLGAAIVEIGRRRRLRRQ